MFKSRERGWNIPKDGWAVLKRHPRLLVFPVPDTERYRCSPTHG